MRKRVFIIFVTFLCMLSFCLAGCENGGGRYNGAVESDFETKTYEQDKYIIMFADEIDNSYLTESGLSLYKELGMTTIAPADIEPDKMDSVMEAVSRSGMTIMPGIFGCRIGEDEKFQTYCKDIDFKKYPAFTGFYMFDEPSSILFDWLKTNRVDWYNENYSEGSYWHINLLQSYAGYVHLRTTADPENDRSAYENYVYQYVEKVLKYVQGAKGIGTDNYALRTSGSGEKKNYQLRDSYLYDIAVVSAAARDNNVNFHNCIQCYTDRTNDPTVRPITTTAEVSFQLYASMAFGARMFEFYGYMSRGALTCMVGTDNKPNETYYYVKEAIKEIQKFDRIYMNFDWQGFYTLNGTDHGELYARSDFTMVEKYALKEVEGIKNITATQDTLIGQLEDGDGDMGYMVLSYNDPLGHKSYTNAIPYAADVVKLQFEGNIDKVVVYRGGNEIKYMIKDGTIELPLAPGEGVFVLPIK